MPQTPASSSTSIVAGVPRSIRISFFGRRFPSTDPKRKPPGGWPPRTRLLTCRGTRSTLGPPMPRRGCPSTAPSTGYARSTATNPGTTNCAPKPSITVARPYTPTLRTIQGCSNEQHDGDWSANDWVSSERILEHVSGRGTNNEAIVPTAQPSAGAPVRWACRSDNRTRVGRVTLQRMDNVGIVVESLDAAISFFAELGLELEGRAMIEGDWSGRVTGLRDQRVEIAMMRTPDGHGRIELSRFLAPPVVADHRNAPVNALGYLRIMFAVEDIDDTLARLRPHGAQLVDEVVQYEDVYRLCYVRGPEGILIGLAEQIG